MNSDDVDTSVTLPRTLENVWYRADEPPADLINYAAEGTLVVSDDALVFSSSQMSLTIGVRNIRQVVWRKLQGDRENEWAVVYFRDGGVEKIAGFAAADRYVFHTSNKELYSAIVKATRGVGTSPR